MRAVAVAVPILLAVTIVAAVAGAAVRIPGTTLRFGATPASFDSTWAALPAAGDSTVESRRGAIAFFGIPANATLTFSGGALTEAEFEADSTSPAARAYIEDELTREGYRRRCTRWDPDAHVCDWSGRTELRLESSPRSLKATAKEAVPAPVAAAPPVAPAAPAPARSAGPASARDMEAMARALAKPATPTAAAPFRPVRPAVQDTMREYMEPDLPIDQINDVVNHILIPIDLLPVVDSCVAVRPEAAKRAGVFGTVQVKVVIDSTGVVKSATVARGVPELNRAALDCARRYRFARFTSSSPVDRTDRILTIRFTQ